MAEKETEPKVADAVTQQGSTFAERAAAASGKKVTQRKVDEPWHNSTFAERAGGVRKSEGKQVDAAENKAVGSSEAKSSARKKS